MKRFADSVGHITGQGLGVALLDDSHALALQEEIHSLRLKVEQLTAEVSSATYLCSVRQLMWCRLVVFGMK